MMALTPTLKAKKSTRAKMQRTQRKTPLCTVSARNRVTEEA
jgi:hypothetical protein